MIKMKIDPDKLKVMAKAVVAQLAPKAAEAGGLRGWAGIRTCALWVVRAVEKIGIENGLVGEDQQTIAVQAILDLVPDRWLPDALIAPFVRWIVDRAVISMKADAAKV